MEVHLGKRETFYNFLGGGDDEADEAETGNDIQREYKDMGFLE